MKNIAAVCSLVLLTIFLYGCKHSSNIGVNNT